MEAMKERPPYVVFEHRPIEDREASIAAGRLVQKDVPFALITPAGSRDRIEKRAEQWLEDKARDVAAGRMPEEWLRGFHAKFEAWQKGQAEPLDGTPLSSWTLLTPAQAQNLKSLGMNTVEHVAAANAEALAKMGMGALELKQKAAEWLATANNQGAAVAELERTRAELAMAKDRIAALEADNEALLAELVAEEEAETPKRRGRPPKAVGAH